MCKCANVLLDSVFRFQSWFSIWLLTFTGNQKEFYSLILILSFAHLHPDSYRDSFAHFLSLFHQLKHFPQHLLIIKLISYALNLLVFLMTLSRD